MACWLKYCRGLQLRNISNVDNAIGNSSTRSGKKCNKRLKCIQQVAKVGGWDPRSVKTLDQKLWEEVEEIR